MDVTQLLHVGIRIDEENQVIILLAYSPMSCETI